MIDLDGMISIPYLKKPRLREVRKNEFHDTEGSGREWRRSSGRCLARHLYFSVTEDEKKTFQEFSSITRGSGMQWTG